MLHVVHIVKLSHFLVELRLVAIITVVLLTSCLHQSLTFLTLVYLGSDVELCLHLSDFGLEFCISCHVLLYLGILLLISNSNVRIVVTYSRW